MFLMESTVVTNDSIFDILGNDTQETRFIQKERNVENLKREVSNSIAEREYIGIYLRTQNE